jgi:hypothetical protein
MGHGYPRGAPADVPAAAPSPPGIGLAASSSQAIKRSPTVMADLVEQFEQAAQVAALRRSTPSLAQARESIARLDALHREATQGPPAGREAAMRQYIELMGDLGQQDA